MRRARRPAALLPALAGALALAAGDAPPVRITLSAEPPRVTVGDPVAVSVEIAYPDGFEVSSPAPGPEWGPLLVSQVERGEPRRAPDGSWRRVDRLKVAAFAPGPVETPSLKLEYRSPDGAVGEVTSPPLSLSVESVLLPGEPPEISDLKEPASLPRPLWPWIAAGLGALAAAAGAALWLAWRRKRLLAALAEARAGPPLPPEEWALQELARLEGADLVAEGRWLEYHVILSEVVKEYLTRRFNIPTLERTTTEVLAAARAAPLGSKVLTDLRPILGACDMVKFARHQPARAAAEAVLVQARGLVEAGRPAVAEVAPAAGSGG